MARKNNATLASPSQQLAGELRQQFLDPKNPLARILDLADDAIISVNREHLIILFSNGAEKMFGYSARDVYSKPLDILLPERLAAAHRGHIAAFDQSKVTARKMGERRDILGRRKDGTEFPAEATISKVVLGSEPIFTVIMRDVTQQALLADERLRHSLREKEILLKEIHHRVKNNLQVVSSLLGLQARAIADLTIRKQFEESKYRIQSMALLHETLFQSDNLASVDFSDYIHRLAEQLYRSYKTSNRVSLRVELQEMHFHVDAAVPCGLIVNELMSNSLKYGFPGARRGEVRVELHKVGESHAELVVADDGIGLREGVDWLSTRTLGLRLVRTLAEQVRGIVALDRSRGTSFRILFPRTDPH